MLRPFQCTDTKTFIREAAPARHPNPFPEQPRRQHQTAQAAHTSGAGSLTPLRVASSLTREATAPPGPAVAAPALRAQHRSARTTLSLPVTATANTDYAAISLPAGAIDVAYKTITTTAYTAVTDAKISIGSTAGGVDYVAATTIAAIGVKSHTPVDAAAAVHLAPGALTFFVRVTQSGGSTAVGAATLIFTYGLPVS